MKKADPAGSVHLIDIPLMTRQIGIVDLVQTPLAQDHIPRLPQLRITVTVRDGVCDCACGAPHIHVDEVIDQHWIPWRRVDFVVDVGLVEHGGTGMRLDGRDYPSKNFDLSIAVQSKGVPLRGINAGNVVQRQAAHHDIGGGYVGDLGVGEIE